MPGAGSGDSTLAEESIEAELGVEPGAATELMQLLQQHGNPMASLAAGAAPTLPAPDAGLPNSMEGQGGSSGGRRSTEEEKPPKPDRKPKKQKVHVKAWPPLAVALF